MGYMDYLNGDLCYIIQLEINGEVLYMYTKRAPVHFPDLAKKFIYRRSAYRFMIDSPYYKNNYPCKILKYNRKTNDIIYKN
jgi:hypothetical protein